MPSKCEECGENISNEDSASCANCKTRFHVPCLNDPESYKELSRKGKINWHCSNCTEEEEIDSLKKNMSSIKKSLNKIVTKIDELNTLKESTEFVIKQYDEMKAKMDKNNTLLSELTKTINELTSECGAKDKIIANLNLRINKMEQREKDRNVEISQVPEQPNENCQVIIKQIATNLNVTVENADIENVYRLSNKQKDRPGNIIVEFTSKKKRNELLSKRSCIVYEGTPKQSKIFINETLTRYYKQLFFLTKRMARELGYKFIWFKNDKILVRKIENSQVIVIDFEEDLRKLNISGTV